MTDEKPNYNEADIKLLNPIVHARIRPGMYIGGTDSRALHNLITTVLDEAIEETLAGYCDHIWITLRPNQEVIIRHNGRGISLQPERNGKSLLEVLMTESAIKRINADYQIIAVMRGNPVYAVNALSTEFKVESACDGFLWQQSYREGVPQSDVIQVRPLEPNESTGLTITFQPDFTIMELNEFDYEVITNHARDLSCLFPNLTITIRDDRANLEKTEEYHFPNGFSDLVTHLNRDSSVIYGPTASSNEWSIRSKDGTESTLGVEIFLQYSSNMETNIIGFIDLLRTDDGFHTDIIPLVLTATGNHLMPYLSEEPPFTFDEIAPGLTIVVHLKHPDRPYRRNEYIGLINPTPGVCGIVADTIYHLFPLYAGDKKTEPLIQKWLDNRRFLEEK